MVWARRHRVTGSPSKVEVDVSAIPLLPASGWRLHPVEEWPLIGAAPKGYLAYGDPTRPDCRAYIAKKGRLKVGGNRECVTEEMISKIGGQLPVRMAKSRLVRLPVPEGQPPDVRFLSRNFIRYGEERLVHGVEIVAEYFNAQPDEVNVAFNLDDRLAEHNFYTVYNLVEVFKWFCQNAEERTSILNGFARMLAFDALVGAPDRHALNWGVVASLVDRNRPRRFAPLFDTARGLFREYPDDKLSQIAAAAGQVELVQQYARKSQPVFGVRTPMPGGLRCNHFELVEHVLRDLPDDLGHTMARFIRAVHVPDVATMLRRRFRRIVTPLRLSYIVRLLRYRHERLTILVNRS